MGNKKPLNRVITHGALVALLQGMSGAAPVGILATTDAKAKKTNNPIGEITKTVRAVAMVGADYQTSVQNSLLKEGETKPEFKAETLPWGEWLVPNKVIRHKGAYYLRTQTTGGMRRKQAARVLCYRDREGKFLSPETVKPLLPAVKESGTQAAAGLEGTKRQVWVRTYAFASLDRIRIGGVNYAVKPD